MAGYNGYSMSNNAVAAYADGEKQNKRDLLHSVAAEQVDESRHYSSNRDYGDRT